MNNSRHSLALACILLCGGMAASADDGPESTRVYGRVYVEPIEVGAVPPVCVAEPICGPKVKTTVQAMRDPQRPAVLIFCKEFPSQATNLLTALDASTNFAGIPLILTVTGERGIAGAAPERFSPEHYLQTAEVKQLATQLTEVVSRMGLANTTVGVAKNRFWRDSLGYAKGDDVVVAYVRGKVLSVVSLNSTEIAHTTTAQLVTQLGDLHRQSLTELDN